MWWRFVGAAGIAALLFAADSPKTDPGQRWDQVYRMTADPRVPREASVIVREAVARRKPGRALDVGMGQGRNALYLARRGWDVTGVDLSTEAVAEVNRIAARDGLKLTAAAIDFAKFNLGEEQWDLIVCLYIHGLATANAERLTQALRPGGLLVIEGYHAAVREIGMKAISGVPNGYGTNELTRTFGALRILRYEEFTGRAEWSNGPDGTAPLVRFVGQKQ